MLAVATKVTGINKYAVMFFNEDYVYVETIGKSSLDEVEILVGNTESFLLDNSMTLYELAMFTSLSPKHTKHMIDLLRRW